MAKPRMTRAHYKLIAETVASLGLRFADKHHVALMMRTALTGTNPAFDPAAFTRACGVAL